MFINFVRVICSISRVMYLILNPWLLYNKGTRYMEREKRLEEDGSKKLSEDKMRGELPALQVFGKGLRRVQCYRRETFLGAIHQRSGLPRLRMLRGIPSLGALRAMSGISLRHVQKDGFYRPEYPKGGGTKGSRCSDCIVAGTEPREGLVA